MALQEFFSSLRFNFFHKPGLVGCFPHRCFIFPQSQPDPLIVGTSDIGQGDYGPEAGNWVQKSNPGPTKKIVCKARGSNPADQLKRSFVQSCTQSRNTIAKTIASMIARAMVKITCAQMHEHVPHGMRPPDDERRPDQPNNGQTVRIF